MKDLSSDELKIISQRSAGSTPATPFLRTAACRLLPLATSGSQSNGSPPIGIS